MTDCPFCAIAAGTAPASLVAETAQAIAFLDLRQPVPGHVLVIPRQHVETIYTLEPGTAAEVMQLAVRVAKALRACFDPPGLNLWQSNGQAGGQEVPHFHLHLQPRLHRDGLLRLYPGGLPPPASRARLDDLAAQLHPYCREQR
ncbi:HIT family protein [Pseudoxanthomonas wuyuanensis]|uniref:Histidine triad (HIT) family protein n=1 Tax=Pseudoxanthomonas wuyuanensis TaxID=1073196 RepID=A0A286D387_9GAMM|nr:HIT domain-containing protein [Pseudoxanthomonas wuyuanensis]KAF1722997.1 HIT domain-containing protein [Pseudoxanthomonas wuyuanensis]SOD53113.1 histidine triad (HIT) family protein [Pseudoxanthomonas wuyuanensis]